MYSKRISSMHLSSYISKLEKIAESSRYTEMSLIDLSLKIDSRLDISR